MPGIGPYKHVHWKMREPLYLCGEMKKNSTEVPENLNQALETRDQMKAVQIEVAYTWGHTSQLVRNPFTTSSFKSMSSNSLLVYYAQFHSSF